MIKIFMYSILLVLLSACSIVDSILPKDSGNLPSGTVLFSDTFSSPDSGWNTLNQNGSYVIYQADGLRFLIDKPNLDFYSMPGYDFTDVRIEAEAIKIDGPDNNSYGIICRMQNEKNYYAFVISSDGYAGIIRVQEGIYELINSDSMEFAASINQGKSINYLEATCQGNELSFDINGVNQFLIKDNRFSSGDVGLIAGSFEEPGVDIFFDNLTVFQP